MIECFAENNCIQAKLHVFKKKKGLENGWKKREKKKSLIGMKHI